MPTGKLKFEIKDLHLKEASPSLVNENGETVPLQIEEEILSGLLLQSFPEMQVYYEDIQQYWETESPCLEYIMDDVVQPYLVKALHDGNQEALVKLFNFFELLASSNDNRAKSLLSIGICETLVGFDYLYDAAVIYIKPETEKIYNTTKAALLV